MPEVASEPAARTLRSVQAGERATVASVSGRGPTRRRLLEMGVTPGAIVKVERVAPLGDPVEVSVRGSRLTLRKADIDMVIVRPVGAISPASP
ncbi:MAG: ferrous iron transport protein A [Bifidobacteriaceae bacterium]|nr:ferrous iron transport protein A [Bifidobacteriaceae bacterium]